MTHILIPREPSTALLRPFIGCNSQELHEAWAAMVRIAEVQYARAGSQCLQQIEEDPQSVDIAINHGTEDLAMHPLSTAPAALAGPAWDKTRDSLATLLLGLARRPFLDFDVACIALDAATEPGMPLAHMRGAQAAPALETPSGPATSAQVQALHRARRALHAIGKTYDDSELRTRALEADEEIDRMLAAAPQTPAQEAPAAPAVPAGFALVPIEPTQQMLDAGRWSGAGSVSIQEEWARKEMWSRMLATITPPPAAYTDDLVALVENLAQALSAAAPDNDLAGHALNYLKRNGLQESPLRAAEAAPQAPAKGLPYEPTSDMLIAGRACDPALPVDTVRAIWWAMWRTAPQAPAAPAEAQRLAQFLQDRQTCLGASRASAGKYNQEFWDDYERAWTMLLGMAAPAAPSAIATQVIENLLQLARIVNTAVEDWGETKEDDSLEVIFQKEEADKMESILEFFDSLPDAPEGEGVILSGPSRAARVLRAMAPAAPAVDAADSARIDWLQTKAVSVREPMRDGPREIFWAGPVDRAGISAEPSDLRARIDAAQAAAKGAGDA